MLGFFAGALTTASIAPQLIKCIRSKSTKDVSLAMLVSVSTGMALWLAHGLVIHDLALVAANGASLTLAIPLLILKIRNDHGHFFQQLFPLRTRRSRNPSCPYCAPSSPYQTASDRAKTRVQVTEQPKAEQIV